MTNDNAPDAGSAKLSLFGWVFFLAGFAAAIYAAAFMGVAVETDALGPVANLSMIAAREITLHFGVGIMIVGALFMIGGHIGDRLERP